MKPSFGRLAATLALAFTLPATAGGTPLAQLAHEAAAGSRDAADQLRALGPGGLEALLGTAAADPGVAASATYQAALDRVCAQRDCAASRLYWYTDLAAARKAAEESGRPILSLRLLGRLDEELSCANSRFFRAVLYANDEVSRALRERFVLHWSSERPVPKVTVDFGDGRRLAGTVTGNSIHYVLDARGRLVDALPGLYGPATFLAVLGRAEDEARRTAQLADGPAARELGAFHERQLAAQTRLFDEAEKATGEALEDPLLLATAESSRALPSPALMASALAMSKTMVERPLLRQVSLDRQTWELPLEGAAWDRLDRRFQAEARLDAASRRLLLAKSAAWLGGDREVALARFEALIAEDTERNELVLHRKIHGWLMEEELPDWAAFNEQVYRELFLTPKSDPWLGLGPSEIFAVLTPAP